MERIKILPVIAALAALVPTPALVWGQAGHRIIGQLGSERIDGKTCAEIERIIDNESLAEAATFADEQKSNPDPFWQETASPWHYVTVPEGKTYAEVGAPPEGDAYTALQRFTATLRDPSASKADKAVALRFIIHIVGDLHQPMHVGNGTDRGGNDERVMFFGKSTNLHSIWDSALIDGQNLSFTEYAARLDRRITPQLTIAWWDPNPLTWIAESAKARAAAYPNASEGATPNLGYSYQFEQLPTVELRLEQGGVRLAAYLDSIWQSDTRWN